MKSKIQPGKTADRKVASQAPQKTVQNPIQNKLNVRFFYLIIAVFAFILYGNTLSNYYSLDDSYVTSVNPVVQKGIKAIPEIFTSNYISMNAEEGGQHNYGYRPMAKASFAIEWSIFRGNPHVSHFFNVLLYALTGLLLFSLLRRLLKNQNILLPFLTVLFFMAHPLHTEVVASLKNREELFSFLGALLSVRYFLKWNETGKKINILWALLAFAFGWLSKVNIMTFIIIIPLIFYYFTDVKPKKIIIASLMIIGVIALLLLIPRLFLGTSVRPMQFIENPLQFAPTLSQRIGTSMMVLLFYLKMLVFPHPLVFYYGYNMIPIATLANPLVWLSLLIHVALFGYAVYTIRKKSVLSFAILFYLVNISIFSNLLAPPTGIVAERFLYIASLGFCLALTYGLFKLFKANPNDIVIPAKARNFVVLLAILICIPAMAKTIDRNKDWKTEMTLYEADMPNLVNSAKANYIYATNLRSSIVDKLKAGIKKESLMPEIETIIKHYKRAVNVYPEYPDAYNNLGESMLLLLNESDSSIQYFEKAVKLNLNLTAAYFNLGYTYQITEQYDKAILNYEIALEKEPWDIKIMSNLAQMYFKTGNTKKAISINEDIIKLDPTLDLPYINLGSYLIKEGETQKAMEYFNKALEINPANFNLSMKLHDMFIESGDSVTAEYYLDLARKAQ